MRRLSTSLLFALAMTFSFTATAQQGQWNESWRPYGLSDLASTSVFAGIAIGANLFGAPATARWNREILLDLPMRKLIGGRLTETEDVAAAVSDGLVSLLMVAPFGELSVASYRFHDRQLAESFAGIGLQSYALTFAVTGLTKTLVGRERPRRATCFWNVNDPCEARPPVSFFSGHSSAAFTGAGLICAFNDLGALHGDGIASHVPCVSALTIAAATAVLRIVANKHHLSDVVIGTLVGLGSGWALPLLRFRE